MLLGIGAALAQMLSTTAFAIEESDVEAAINASSAEVVSGNVFIWFLCALAFLKISQKIDSFMSSLGVNVGRTGGSMLGELMIAGRALGAAAKATGGAIGNLFGGGRGGQAGGQSGQTAQQAAGENLAHGKGLAGIAMSAAAPAAVASLTGKGKAGIRNTVVGSMVDSSINSGGQFAASVVGAIAKGNYSRDGSITGERAAQALTSYLGYQAAGAVAGTEGAPIPTTSIPSNDGTGASSDVSRPGEDVVTMEGGTSAAAMAAGMGIGSSQEVGHTPTPSDGSVTSKLNSGTAPIGSKPPTFSDVKLAVDASPVTRLRLEVEKNDSLQCIVLLNTCSLPAPMRPSRRWMAKAGTSSTRNLPFRRRLTKGRTARLSIPPTLSPNSRLYPRERIVSDYG